jgi:hypothetical protein
MNFKSVSLLMGVIACIGLSVPAFAAKKSANKMTCEDFIALDEVSRPEAVYWADGYNWYGQNDDAYIDFSQNDQLVPMVVSECTKTPKEKFVAKVKTVSKKAKT